MSRDEPIEAAADGEEGTLSFADEMNKPDIGEGMWQRKDTLSAVIRRVCESDKGEDEKRSLVETAIDEFKTSTLELLAEGKFEDHGY